MLFGGVVMVIEKIKISNFKRYYGVHTIISVSGLSFERYLDVAKELKIKVAVITDNDGNYEQKITDKYKDYLTFDPII